MEKDTTIFLKHIFESIEQVQNYVKDISKETFLVSTQLQDSVARRLEIIGEATKNLPEDFKIKHPEIPWRKITGMRDNLIHEYFNFDEELVWNVLINYIPEFKKQISDLLNDL